jgi:threonine dehydrogenase-like Zn-dependent dehydrogenase
VIEATGSPDGFALARQAVRPQGTIVLKSTYKGERLINLSSLVVDEITLIGSRCGPFAPALRLLEQQAVDPTILIEERLPLEQGIMALKRAGERGVLKILLYPTNAL